MRLILNVDGHPPRTIDSEESLLSVGRSSKAFIRVESDEMSRLHLEIIARDGVFYVKDLGSANGTFINNIKLIAHKETFWATFFPIQISDSISISFEQPPESAIMNPVDSRKPVKDEVKVRKKLSKPAKSQSKFRVFFLILITGGITLFFIQYYKKKVPATLKSGPIMFSNSLKRFSEVTQQAGLIKCQGSDEEKLCAFLGTKTSDEGVNQFEGDLFIYFDFMSRINAMEIRPDFAEASGNNRMIYLMSYMAFDSKIRAYIKKNGYHKLTIVNISNSPFKINHVLKIQTEALLDFNTTDINLLFGQLSKADSTLFDSLIVPIIEVSSAN